MTKEKIECIWSVFNTEHKGPITSEKLFAGQLIIPVCAEHLRQHEMVMFLTSHGHNVDGVMKYTLDEAEKAFEEIKRKFPDDSTNLKKTESSIKKQNVKQN